MLAAAGQACQELFTPPFRAVLFKCVAFTIGLLALLIAVIVWSFGYFAAWPDWIETTIQWLGGFALVVGSIFLIPPVTSLIAGLYLDDIAAVVEKEHYPADPPGKQLATLPAIGLALKFSWGANISNSPPCAISHRPTRGACAGRTGSPCSCQA
jgi:CysZ protein